MPSELTDDRTAPPTPSSHAGDLGSILILVLLFLGLGLFLPAGFGFPIGDSWSYSWSAQQLVEHGRFQLTDFGAMSLVGQLFLAAPVGLLFSPAPSTLNLLTFVLAGLISVFYYGVLRRMSFAPGWSLFGAATLVCNPIFLAQSVTFDTEVFCLLPIIVGLFFVVGWDGQRRSGQLWLAGIFFAYAVLVRQHAIIFVPAGLGYLFFHRTRNRASVFPWLLPALALAGFYLWVTQVHGLPKAFQFQQGDLAERLSHPLTLGVEGTTQGLLPAVHYLGLFLFPVLLLRWTTGPGTGKTTEDRTRHRFLQGSVLVSVAILGATALLFIAGQRMPYLPNILTPFGVLGPLGAMNQLEQARILLTLISGIMGVVMVTRLTFQVGERGRIPLYRFLLLAALLLLGFSIITGLRFDRYLLLPLPFLIPFFLPRAEQRVGRRSGGFGLLALAGALVFSAFFVDQRIRFFRCEWEAAENLVAQGYQPREVDGGFAFNGYYSYDYLSRTYDPDTTRPFNPRWNPGALVFVRAAKIVDPALLKVGEHRCPNHFSLQTPVFHIYRRKE